MRRTGPLRKPSFRDHIGEVNRAMRGQEAMFGDLREAKGMPVPALLELGPKREHTQRMLDGDKESAVMDEVEIVIQDDPRILLAWRQNSGGTWLPSKGGKDAPVHFYYFIKRPRDERGKNVPMRIVDYGGLATFGFWVLETKHRHWHYTGKENEPQQKAYIDAVIAGGGRGGFVTSAEQAQAILK